MAVSLSTIKSHLQVASEERFIPVFKEAGNWFGIPLPAILALASRETQMGTIGGHWTSPITGKRRGSMNLKPLEGDRGYGHGIIQVDSRYHAAFVKKFGEDGYTAFPAYVAYGTWVFRDFMNQWAERGYKGEKLLLLSFASYNKGGPPNVNESRPDTGTAGGNYATDTLERWKLFAQLLNDRSLPKQLFVPKGFPKRLTKESVTQGFPLIAKFAESNPISQQPKPSTTGFATLFAVMSLGWYLYNR